MKKLFGSLFGGDTVQDDVSTFQNSTQTPKSDPPTTRPQIKSMDPSVYEFEPRGMLTEVPDELILHILSYLQGSPQGIMKFTHVCHNFSFFGSKDEYWKPFLQKIYPKAISTMSRNYRFGYFQLRKQFITAKSDKDLVKNPVKDIKLAVCGEKTIGKTALVVNFVMGQFITDYDPTIEDSYRKQCKMSDDRLVLFEILDTAGDESFSSLTDMYIRFHENFILCYSATDLKSIDRLMKIYDRIQLVKDLGDSEMRNLSFVVVGLKSDCTDKIEVKDSDLEGLLKKVRSPHIKMSNSAKDALLKCKEVFEALYYETRYSKFITDAHLKNLENGTPIYISFEKKKPHVQK